MTLILNVLSILGVVIILSLVITAILQVAYLVSHDCDHPDKCACDGT